MITFSIHVTTNCLIIKIFLFLLETYGNDAIFGCLSEVYTMKGFLTDELILDLKNITASNISFVNKKCKHLGENQIQWRPEKKSWNLQEVLSHLNGYANFYH